MKVVARGLAVIFLMMVTSIVWTRQAQAVVCYGTRSGVSPEQEFVILAAVKNAFEKTTRTKEGLVHTNIALQAGCGIDFKIRYVSVTLGFKRKDRLHRVTIFIDHVVRFAGDNEMVSHATYDVQGRMKSFIFKKCTFGYEFCVGGNPWPRLNPVPYGEWEKAGAKITRFMSVYAGTLLAEWNTNVRPSKRDHRDP